MSYLYHVSKRTPSQRDQTGLKPTLRPVIDLDWLTSIDWPRLTTPHAESILRLTMAGVDPLRCCLLLLTLTIQLRHKRNMPEDEGTPGKKRGKGKQGRSWNKEDDKKLERLLKNGDIDIRENLGVTNTGLIFTRKVWSTFPKSQRTKRITSYACKGR